jgi:hypothetical protein
MSTNPVSLTMTLNFTEEVLSEVTLQDEPFKGKTFEIIRLYIPGLLPKIEHMKFSATPKL